MKHISRSKVFLIFSTILLAFMLNSNPGRAQDDQTEPSGQVILVVLYPYKTTTLSSRVQAIVAKIHHEMGQRFQKKTALIDLDYKLYQGEKSKAEALLVYEETNYKTMKKLYDQKSVSEIEYARSKADLEVARANLLIANKRLEACFIHAPYNGKVLKLLVNENELVQPGQPLIEIVDDSIIQTKFLAPAGFREKLAIGQTLPVKINGVAETIDCRLTHISPVLESNTGTFQVFGEIDNSGKVLRGGMTGEILLSLTNRK